MAIDSKDIAPGAGLEALGKVQTFDKMTFPVRPEVNLKGDFNPDSVADKLAPSLIDQPGDAIKALGEPTMGNYFTSDLSKMDGAGERRPYPEGSSARVPGPINTEAPSPIFTLPDRPPALETPPVVPVPEAVAGGGGDPIDTGAYYSSDLKGMPGAGQDINYPEGSSARVPGPINTEAPVAPAPDAPTIDDKQGERKPGLFEKVKDKIRPKKEQSISSVDVPAPAAPGVETPPVEADVNNDENPLGAAVVSGGENLPGESPAPEVATGGGRNPEEMSAVELAQEQNALEAKENRTPDEEARLKKLVTAWEAKHVEVPASETDAESSNDDEADTPPAEVVDDEDSHDAASGGGGNEPDGDGDGNGSGGGESEANADKPPAPETGEEPDAEDEASTPEDTEKTKRISELEDKLKKDGKLTRDEIKELNELKSDPEVRKRDLESRLGTLTPEEQDELDAIYSKEDGPALSDKEKLEKDKKEMEDLGTEMMMKIARGEIPTEEERARMEELYGDVQIQELGFTKERARALWKESQKSRYGSERGARRIKDLQEKAQEMLMLEYQLMTIGERFKQLKEKRDEAMSEYKAKIDATNSAGLEERPKAKSEEVSALFTLLGIKGELAGMKYFAIEADARIRDLDQELKYKAGATDGWDALKDWAGAKVQSLVTEIVILADETLPDMGRSDSI